ncbi:Putative protein [Zobellia galactanivorans]|uniref:Uncharacterized protein n=1 Tax=Zobellia galactanivorans (strain DSM 12802 / CCUG 47099 / CIP 106680 / NCIMB 13871 / Dsij) TaxID=63186 RepID=G0LAP2_ZOBGA|nr:Putative protein [Zobellia galactanivorans]
MGKVKIGNLAAIFVNNVYFRKKHTCENNFL